MSKQPPAGDFCELLLAHRRELDALDEQLVSLLAARFAVTRRIGALKAAHGVPAADAERERAQLESLTLLSRELGLPSDVTRALYQTLFQFVRENHLTQAVAANESPGAREPG